MPIATLTHTQTTKVAISVLASREIFNDTVDIYEWQEVACKCLLQIDEP